MVLELRDGADQKGEEDLKGRQDEAEAPAEVALHPRKRRKGLRKREREEFSNRI